MIRLITEPRDETYKALLSFAVSRCESFSLIWRYRLSSKNVTDNILNSLGPFLVTEEETREWPGTQLLKAKATIRHYQCTPEVLPILYSINGLYQWLHPKYPEDLVFYLKNGESWLTSISHERESWISDTSLTAEELLRAIPTLRIQ